MTLKRDGGGDDAESLLIDADERWTQVGQHHYDPEQDTELTTALVYALAEAEGVSPTDLKSPPLYEVIDAASLEDTFFGLNENDSSHQVVGTVAFRYNQYRVEVRSDRWIQIYEPVDNDR